MLEQIRTLISTFLAKKDHCESTEEAQCKRQHESSRTTSHACQPRQPEPPCVGLPIHPTPKRTKETLQKFFSGVCFFLNENRNNWRTLTVASESIFRRHTSVSFGARIDSAKRANNSICRKD